VPEHRLQLSCGLEGEQHAAGGGADHHGREQVGEGDEAGALARTRQEQERVAHRRRVDARGEVDH
jgi:hypothetical protein